MNSNLRLKFKRNFLNIFKNQIALCLLASIILKNFSNHFKNIEANLFDDSSIEFEDLAIKIVNLFDKNEDNDFDLVSEIPFLDCNLLLLAKNGECTRFISTISVQRILSQAWANSITFYPEQLIIYKPENFFYENFKVIYNSFKFTYFNYINY